MRDFGGIEEVAMDGFEAGHGPLSVATAKRQNGHDFCQTQVTTHLRLREQLLNNGLIERAFRTVPTSETAIATFSGKIRTFNWDELVDHLNRYSGATTSKHALKKEFLQCGQCAAASALSPSSRSSAVHSLCEPRKMASSSIATPTTEVP